MSRLRKEKPFRKRSWDEERDIDAASREPRRLRQRSVNETSRLLTSQEYFTAKETNGIVVSPYGVLAFVEHEGVERLCRVVDRLTDGKTSILSPGDYVWIEQVSGQWMVREVAPLKSVLQYYSEGKTRIIAANVDRLLVVASALKPRFKPGFVDRCLIAAEACGVPTIICLNKIDLVETVPQEIQDYAQLGFTVVVTSCVTGAGLSELRQALENTTTVLCGQSGVGKSSLIKALAPELDIAVSEVSRTREKGRHTTTASRMYRVGENIRLIDTPGVKTLGVWGVSPEELDYYFPEFHEYALSCCFRDCTHIHEPSCAIREALERGEIVRRRYESYRRIRQDIEEHQERNLK
ncbi:MAG TPA: ribosome small subunit-dependent GTPase A [Candidatus Hydrogenedentes bacterium]|nr:ribosome small subunit-dependent GTPase A [Candidatus Hydrogenedentota bacterium]HOL76480.1 ribosome small subunit-dependent GTPase A [Candidatus Hydrogenedentota bacterium]